MSYTVYDFEASMDIVGIPLTDIALVEAAWGHSGDYAEWGGGFLLNMFDGTWKYVTGWCDTTGWGCQDGADVTVYDRKPMLSHLSEAEWDILPADLNIELGKAHEVLID
jgi:hypothetical protein